MICREQGRDAIVELGEFTINDLASKLWIARSTALGLIEWAIEKGIAEEIGHRKTGHAGRPARLFRHAPLPAGPKRRPRSPDLISIVARRSSGQPVKRRRKAPDSEMNRLMRKLERSGWRVEWKNGHPVLISPGGERIVAAATPSDHRSMNNLRAALRRAGAEI